MNTVTLGLYTSILEDWKTYKKSTLKKNCLESFEHEFDSHLTIFLYW